MQKENFVKFFSTLALALVFIILSGLYLNYIIDINVINDKIHKVTKHLMPSSRLEIKDLNYHLGTHLAFTVNKVQLNSVDGVELLLVDKVRVEMSYWTLISSEGKLDTKLSGINILGNENRWRDLVKEGQSELSFNVPSLFGKSKLNFYLKNVTIHNDENNEEKPTFIKKLKLKNLSLRQNTVFEAIISDFKYKKNLGAIHAIGEFNLRRMIEEHRLESRFSFKLNNFNVGEKGIKLKGATVLSGNLDEMILKTSLNSGNHFTSTFQIKVLKNILHVDDITASMPFIELEKYVPELIHQLSFVDFNETEFNIKGSLSILNNKITQDLHFESTQAIQVNLGPFERARGKIKGQYRENQFFITSVLDYLGGKCDFVYGKKKSVSSKVKTSGDIICVNQELSRYDVRKIMAWEHEEITLPEEPKNLYLDKSANLDFKFSNLKLDETSLNFDGQLEVSENTLKFNNIKVLFADDGKIESNVTYPLSVSNKQSEKYTFTFKKVNSNFINMFYPPHINDLSGTLSGQLDISLREKNLENLKINLNINNGNTVAMSLSTLFNYYIETVPNIDSIPYTSDIDRKFSKLLLSASNDDEMVNINELVVVGENEKYFLKLDGLVSLKNNGLSNVSGSLRTKKEKLDFSYSGFGLRLKPDMKNKK